MTMSLTGPGATDAGPAPAADAVGRMRAMIAELAAVCVTAFGLGFGVATIARPAILADRYGTGRYATIAATMTVPITPAKTGAPLAAAALSNGRFLPWTTGACLLAAALLGSMRWHGGGRGRVADWHIRSASAGLSSLARGRDCPDPLPKDHR